MPPAFLYGLIGYCNAGPQDVNTVALEDVSACVTVRGFVAHIKSTLRYRNASQQPLQVMFKTPVDDGSALYHVEAKLEDCTIIAQCLEKKKAEKVYKDAVEAGQTAMLIREESQTADIINLALGNLPAGAECEVTLSLVAELRVAGDGGVQFTLPTVLNPRYQPASSSGSDDHLVFNVTPVATATKPYSIHVSADVCGALDIARVISHSDPINVVIEDDKKRAKISQDGGYRSDHEWSFVVHYNNPYSPQVLVETGDPTATGLMKDQVLMINMFPELPESSYSHFNEVIFVVDRSGSMNGEKIQSARAVLLLFLKSLPPGCRFNIVCFGSSHFFLFKEGSRVYTQETLAEACSLHDKMEADMGSTKILQPLKAIYSQPVDPEFSRQVLILTDGKVWNVDEVTELAARYASSTRVFTVGIGEGASTALVKGLARAGRGRAELVSQRDRMSTKVMGLVASMLQSSVQGVSITCELDPPSRLSLVPPEPPVIFAGQHLVTFARIPPGTLLKKVTLKGKVDGQEWQSCVEAADVRSVHDATYALHRLAARASILHLCLHERVCHLRRSLQKKLSVFLGPSLKKKNMRIQKESWSSVVQLGTELLLIDLEDGVGVMQTKNELLLEQSAYTNALLSRFGIDKANSVATPVDVNADLVTISDEVEDCDKDLYQSAVGSLLY
ncbi:VIT domain [Trinorchestia longiramus]|nr:VIT domain [Trinorchestia longiramus]